MCMISNPSFKEFLVYEDESIVVLDKPHGLLVTQDRYDKNIPYLKKMLSEYYGNIYVVHRLDKGTGGLLVFAKNKDAHRFLCSAFEKAEVRKKYLCIVRGKFEYAVTCMLPLSARAQRGKYKINFKSGRKAVTSFYPVKIGEKSSLVKAELHTGRTHQVRIHLKALGHPLFQDFLYNEKIEDKRLTLYCSNISFKHPLRGVTMHFERPLSSFMQGISERYLNNSELKVKTFE